MANLCRPSFDQFRAYEVSRERLPLARSNRLYSRLSDETLLSFGEHLAQFPEKKGRITDAWRTCFDQCVKPLDQYVIREAHLDITDVSETLENQLVSLGFEIDDFFKLLPACYTRHFTLAYQYDATDRGRVRQIKRTFDDRTEAARVLVENDALTFGYLEVETYSSSSVRKFAPHTHVSCAKISGLTQFLETCALKPIQVSNSSSTDVIASELQSSVVKRADVHVKVKGNVESATGAQKAYLAEVAHAFVTAGFYEIISEAGNSIYTVQFTDAVKAKRLFRDIQSHIDDMPLIAQVCYEPCTFFWRKSAVLGTTKVLSPIPPICV